MLSTLLVLVICNCNPLQSLECYYCNDEQGYYCSHPFPTRSMFNSAGKYHEQLKNIALSSGGNPSMEPVVSCFKTDYYDKTYRYQSTYRGAVRQSMTNLIECQSKYRLSQNPN